MEFQSSIPCECHAPPCATHGMTQAGLRLEGANSLWECAEGHLFRPSPWGVYRWFCGACYNSARNEVGTPRAIEIAVGNAKAGSPRATQLMLLSHVLE